MHGEKIKDKLQELGITQSELATRLGMSRQALASRLKCDDVRTSFLEEIAKICDKHPAFFYGDSLSEDIEALRDSHKQMSAIVENLKGIKW